MTDKTAKKQRRLAYEILGLTGISFVFAVMLFLILSWSGTAVVEIYCYRSDIVMTEYDWLEADQWIWGLSGVLSAVGFSVLFMALSGERMAYIRTITEGIHSLRLGQQNVCLPLEGNNELTELADSINYMSATQKKLREKEQALAKEKEQFIRTLSHDIRTPLTSILAYSQYLAADSNIPQEEQKAHLQMIQKKAEQIRDLTQLLLDGDKRNTEYFDNAHLLMEQLVAEFEEELEEQFTVRTDLSRCPSFAGTFDVQELRRIFDNLISNVHKYADEKQPVHLTVLVQNSKLHICQSNSISADSRQKGSYRLGINSIRRIAQNYGGRVEIKQEADSFSIVVILLDF